MASLSARKEFLCSRWLMKNILKYYFSTPYPSDIVIESDSKGKLRLKENKYMQKLDVDFSLSHSDGMIAFVVGKKKDVGIDIERIGSINERIVKRCFHSKEKALIEEVTPKNREVLSCVLWSLKESFGKALGVGIQPVLKEPRFCLENGRFTFIGENRFKEHPKNWIFKVYLLNQSHILTIAIKKHNFHSRNTLPQYTS